MCSVCVRACVRACELSLPNDICVHMEQLQNQMLRVCSVHQQGMQNNYQTSSPIKSTEPTTSD